MAEKWFGDIPPGDTPKRDLPSEPEQTEKRVLNLEQNVPLNAIYKSYHIVERNHPKYHAIDLLSDILSRGKSSRFHENLVKKNIFSEINAYVTGEFDAGLFMIYGMPIDGISPQEAEQKVIDEIEKIKHQGISEKELTKVLNKVRSILKYEEINVLNKAMNLAIYELIESAELINTELDKYMSVKESDIREAASIYLRESNSSTLYYKKKTDNA